MKKGVILLWLCLGMGWSYAQQYRFEAVSYSMQNRNDKDEWGKWSKATPSKALIVVDEDKQRIAIHTRDLQLFSILESEAKTDDPNTEIQAFSCADNDGWACKVYFLVRKNKKNRLQCFVVYDDVKYVYNVIPLDDPAPAKP